MTHEERMVWAHTLFEHNNHQATLVQANEEFVIVDWRKPNTSEYAIRYILDVKKGTLMIQGDWGFAIACWYNEVKPEKLSSLVSDIGYFYGKIKAPGSQDLCTYDVEDWMADFREAMNEYCKRHSLNPSECKEEADCVIAAMKEYSDLFEATGWYDSKVVEALSSLDSDWGYQGFSELGRRIKGKVYLWSIGWQMAWEQIKDTYDAVMRQPALLLHVHDDVYLAADCNLDTDYPQIYVGLCRNGNWFQDLCFAQAAYKIENRQMRKLPKRYQIAVYADETDCDYTGKLIEVLEAEE